jgi:anti-anti-sigma factor
MSDSGIYRVFRPDPNALDRIEEHHRATFTACCSRESTLQITVEGEVDAANSRQLAGYVERRVVGSEHLILDLRLVDFFGTAGFAALHNINVTCSRYGITWHLRAGRQTRRILAIGDPDGILPLEKPQSVLDDVDASAGDRELLVGGNH